MKDLFGNTYRNWLFKYGLIFLLLVTVYLWLHGFAKFKGEEIVNFTDQEKANIATLVDSYIAGITGFDKRKLTPQHTGLIVKDLEDFITARYKMDTSSKADLRKFLTQFAKSGFQPSFLIEFKLRVESYFWLTENGVFLEIIFWSLFGVLCSLFFYVSESMSRNEYDPDQEYVHVAKLFYAPVTTLVVYFSVNALISNGEVNLNNLKHGLIIVSYILGFFSGRTIELLSRIKEIVLPAGNKDGATPSLANDFQLLDEETQHQLIVDAIEANDEKWRSKLPNIKSIGSGKKYIKDKKTAINAIVFEVGKKDSGIDDANKIPEEVDFQGYKILTDVQERPDELTTQAKKAPGGSVSRFDVLNLGTVGLKVFKKIDNQVTPYLLSCYHVLCLPELLAQKQVVKNGKTDSDPNVVCPARKVAPAKVNSNIVGKVEEGRLSAYLDAAIARLIREDSIDAIVGGIKPKEIYDMKKEDEDSGFLVRAFGAVSRQPTPFKKVLKISVNPEILYDGIGRHVMKQLIQTEKISTAGDSGAPVFTLDDKIVGIIVGGDDVSVSYVLPIRGILNALSVQLTPI